MNIDNLKSIVLALLSNSPIQTDTEKRSDIEETNIFVDTNNDEDVEKLVGDIFSVCDKNGNGEIEDDEMSSLSAQLSSLTGLSGLSFSVLLGEESDDAKLETVSDEFALLEGNNLLQIDLTKEPTKEEIENNEKLLTEIINNDALIPDELKSLRTETTGKLADIQSRIKELEDSVNLTDEQKAELAKLTAEESELNQILKDNEAEILKVCSPETALAVNNLNKQKELYNLTESGETVVAESSPADESIVSNDTSTQGGNDYSSGGGGGGGTDYSPGVTNKNDDKSYANMSLDKLKSELSSEKSALDENNAELQSILNGTADELTSAKEDIETKEENLTKLLQTVAPELSEELKSVREKKEAKEKAIGDKKSEISNKERTVNECQRNFDNAKSAVSNQETIISNLETALASADSEEREEIKTALETAKSELSELKTQCEEAEKKLQTEKDNLTELKGQLTVLENELNAVKTEESELNAKIDELNNEEISTAKTELQNAEKTFETTQSKLEKSVSEKISANEKNIAEIEAAITEKANSAQRSKYSTSSIDGKFTLNGVEYNSLLDGEELQKLSNEIQSGGAGNKWGHPDKCLSFAYSYGLWVDNSTNTPKNGKAAEYPDAGSYKSIDGSKEQILSIVKEQLDEGIPVVLQVNGNKQGNSRHYVTVVGYRSDAGEKLEERDLLILDTYDGLIEGMGDNGSRFMITGAACNKKYKGYQVYIRK